MRLVVGEVALEQVFLPEFNQLSPVNHLSTIVSHHL
jgi:hypothetical protein